MTRAQLALELAPAKGGVDVELFAGAGGMSLGLSAAQCVPDHLFEINKHACATLVHPSNASKITGRLHSEDVGGVDWASAVDRPVRLLSAGPPCQPFSLAGKHGADQDERNEFPSTLRAIRALRPSVVLIENVHGLVRGSFRPYLDYVLRRLAAPSLAPHTGELWNEHDLRLRQHQGATGYEPEYNVTWGVLNAADFGTPQTRSRVIMLATRADLPTARLPAPTHSRDALVVAQESGAYWKLVGVGKPEARRYPKAPPGAAADPKAERLPWVTVRQGLDGLTAPPPTDEGGNSHWHIPGARLYRGHGGSELDWPSKTIKAGVHGVGGGENIVHLDDGTFRYYSLREMARLQDFPDDYAFQGPRSRIIGQIGNAVPCGLAKALVSGLAAPLEAFDRGAAPCRSTERSAGSGTTSRGN